MKNLLRQCVLCLVCTTAGLYAQGQEVESSASHSSATPKAGSHRKKKKVVDDDGAALEAKPGKPLGAVIGDPPITEKAPHAPAATIEVNELAEFSVQPARVQQLITAALDLAKQNLTYTYGSAEPSAGGMDCSGTIYYLFRSQGLKDVPRDSSGQYVWARKHGQFFAVVSTLADSFEFKDLQPGDLMFWSGTYNTGRDVPISHVMLYLGREKGTGKSVMFGSSDGRTYNGIQRWGVSVFDFKMPKADPAKPEKHVDFVGYAHIPGLRDSAVAAALTTTQPMSIPSVAPAAKLALADDLREPERGNPERKLIMDALRAENFPGQEGKVVFAVRCLKIHNGWAWTEVTPQDHAGKSLSGGKPALLHFEGGKWKSVDLSKLSGTSIEPNDGKGASSAFVNNILGVYPDVPRDILPPRH
ncbi:MAG: NlpC/P60 family protein [Chthoniobacter sp.]|uniref:C40 family peptidase n=1 Tax=Chthoniobacter sp. TaxID=2510640 RepID=UPI0032A2A2A7